MGIPIMQVRQFYYCPIYSTVDTMVTNDLVMLGAKASAAMVLT